MRILLPLDNDQPLIQPTHASLQTNTMKLIGLISAIYSLSLASPCLADPLDLGGELQHFSCPPAEKVNSEFCVSVGGEIVEVTDDMNTILQETFRNAYNNLNSQNCDPQSHTVDNVVLVQSERKLQSYDDDLPPYVYIMLIFLLEGECIGCERGLFYGNQITGGRALATSGSGTQDATEDCTCPLHPAHDRAPTEEEFFEEFNKELAAYNLENGGTAITVGPCEDASQSASSGYGGAATMVAVSSALLASISFLLLH